MSDIDHTAAEPFHGDDAFHDDSHQQGEHEAHPPHGKRGGHGAHDGHGGGHGGTWLVTYCDMITLLIAFFICILTFASKENGKANHAKMRDSILYAPGGTDISDPSSTHHDADAVVWRQIVLAANPGGVGASMPPLYSDPTLDVTKKALEMLEEPVRGTLADSYAVSMALAVVFDAQGTITATGSQTLHLIANNLRKLPFDIILQVPASAQLPNAAALVKYLIETEGLPAYRIGLGICAPPELPPDRLRFLFSRKQKQNR